MGVLTSSKLADALDLSKEDPRIVARYGTGDPGKRIDENGAPRVPQSFLAARRLVEAGARVVTVNYSKWDWHGGAGNDIFTREREDFPIFDQGITALVEDLHQRGLDRDVTVLVWGEFGRTPRISAQVGRDHWPRVAMALLAGGGMPSGQVIGSTDRLGGEADSRPVTFPEVFATLYRNLGIDVNSATVTTHKALKTIITLCLREVSGATQISEITLDSEAPNSTPQLKVTRTDQGEWNCYWNGELANKLDVELDHFIPYLSIDRRNIGPRSRQRSWHNAYIILFAQPLADLKKLLSEFHYLGSSRLPPSSLYRPATTPPSEIGINGEFAAQMLHRRQSDEVHFLNPIQVDNEKIDVDKSVQTRSMADAVNTVLKGLSIDAPVSIKEVQDVGFRLFFGDASIQHVGRGLNSLLPLIELGLFADPMRFTSIGTELSLEGYKNQCSSFGHIALEEPEAHLHPKVASRLAHWLVSLAMSNRRLIVETHSDHLVRRLRGLASRASKSSDLESWLLNNVSIVSVEQALGGQSSITQSRLTSEGGLQELWPADFMDTATDEESAIYYARLDKTESAGSNAHIDFDLGDEPQPDESP